MGCMELASLDLRGRSPRSWHPLLTVQTVSSLSLSRARERLLAREATYDRAVATVARMDQQLLTYLLTNSLD
eukprot:scaffold248440_cov79-Attheya_sp.AAC.1